MLNTAATGHVVDAVNNGTRYSANTAGRIVNAVNASNQNNTRSEQSLVDDKVNTEGVLYG